MARKIAWTLLALVSLVVGGFQVPASAQAPGSINQYNAVCNPGAPKQCIAPASDGSIPVTGTFSATLGGFAPNGNYATLSVSNSSSRVALPAGVVVLVQNTGSNTAFINLGDGTVTATTSEIAVPANSWIALTVGANVDLAGITSSSTTSLTLTGGAGLATGAGGGSSGGAGSNVNVTQLGGTNISTGAGSTDAGTQRTTLASDSAGIITTGTAGSASSQVLTVQGIASATPVIATGSGTAGTAATGVSTVQGIASMTPLIVQGGAASGASASGNPVQSGGLAVSSETAVTAGQAAEFITDLARKQIVLPYANPENFVMGTTAAMTGTTSTSIIGAPASGLRNYITNLTCTNSHATVGTFVVLQDGSGGTTFYEAYAAAVGGGFSISLPVPLRQPTTATAAFVQDVTTGANVICSASGYKGA